MRAREAKHRLLQIYLAVLETCAPSKTSASSCIFLLLYAISSSSVRSSRASVVASLWRSLLSHEPVMMGPQYLHRLLFPSHYFLLCHIMRRCPTSYTRCISLYCASLCAPCLFDFTSALKNLQYFYTQLIFLLLASCCSTMPETLSVKSWLYIR